MKEKEYQNILFGSFSINTPDTLSLFPRFTILYNTDIYIHTSSVNFERIHTGMDIFWQSVNFENVNCVTGSDLPRGGEGREKISDMPVSRHAKRCFRNGAQCASIKKNSHPPPSQKYGEEGPPSLPGQRSIDLLAFTQIIGDCCIAQQKCSVK